MKQHSGRLDTSEVEAIRFVLRRMIEVECRVILLVLPVSGAQAAPCRVVVVADTHRYRLLLCLARNHLDHRNPGRMQNHTTLAGLAAFGPRAHCARQSWPWMSAGVCELH